MRHQFDHLVLGSGIAGLSFALQAARQGSVAVIAKRSRSESNTAYAQGGIAAVLAPQDSFEQHIQDTITAGNWSFNLGVRGDVYRGLLSRNAQAEPRAGIAYNIKKTGTVLRAAYARTFETPFNENLIVSSIGCSNAVLNPLLACSAPNPTPLAPGWRNEFHVGLQQAFGRYFVVDAEYIWKYTHGAYDFSVFGNTPIFYPIVWNNSKIPGFAIGIVKDGRLVYSGGFGVMRVGNPDQPVTAGTLFHMASVTVRPKPSCRLFWTTTAACRCRALTMTAFSSTSAIGRQARWTRLRSKCGNSRHTRRTLERSHVLSNSRCQRRCVTALGA